MSKENVEIVSRLTLAFRDPAAAWAAAAKALHPEIEMDTTRFSVPGLARVCTGPDEVARFWGEWLEAWETFGAMEDPELFDGGDRILAWSTHHKMRGVGSGIEIEMPEYGWVMTFRDHKVVRAILYLDKAEALEAAGLRE